MHPAELKAKADKALCQEHIYTLDAVDEVYAVLKQAGINAISKNSLERTLDSRQMSPDVVQHLKCNGIPLRNGGLGTVTAVTDAFLKQYALKVKQWHCAAL
jgi:hypothetical protein